MSESKTKEDIIFSFVALEGGLKHYGCYDDVLKCMQQYSDQQHAHHLRHIELLKEVVRLQKEYDDHLSVEHLRRLSAAQQALQEFEVAL